MTKPRLTVRSLIAAFAISLISACSGGGGDSPAGSVQVAPPPPPPVSITKIDTATDATRFLSLGSFGATKSDRENLVGQSAVDWLNNEFSKPRSPYLPTLLELRSDDGGLPFNSLPPLVWDKFVSGDDQLRQRMIFALSQILVTQQNRSQALRGGYYLDILGEHAFGNYRDLLQDVTYSMEMARFLTYFRNRKGDPRRGRMPDENYARELLQLFTIGLEELNMDGSPKLDGAGDPIPTFDNNDVVGLARVFTGLAGKSAEDNFSRDDEDAEYHPLVMFENQHSTLEKTFLGLTIPENTAGDETITQALDHIFAHPNLAPFVSRQLIQRFTASTPTPAYIERVATAFETGRFTSDIDTMFGTGQRGDLQATLAAILLDPSLFDDSNDANQTLVDGKVREPVLRFVHMIRALGYSNILSSNESQLRTTTDSTSSLGQQAFFAPSVFNFYRPGYVPPGTESGDMNLTVPEFQIINDAAAIGYANFMTRYALARNNQRNGEIESYTQNLSDELALVNDEAALVDHLDNLLTGGRMTTGEKQDIVAILVDFYVDESREDRREKDEREKVQTAILLTVTSPAFMVTW